MKKILKTLIPLCAFVMLLLCTGIYADAATINYKKLALPSGGTFTVTDLYSHQAYTWNVPSCDSPIFLLTLERGDNDPMFFLSKSTFSGSYPYTYDGNTFYISFYEINSDFGTYVHPDEISCPYLHAPESGDRSVYGSFFWGDGSMFEFYNSESYDSSVGALKNVKRNFLYINADEMDSLDEVNCYNRFIFDSKTTLGYSLKKEGTKIRLYESVTYYKRSDNTIYFEGNKVHIDDYDATKLQFDYHITDYYQKVYDATTPDSLPSSIDIVFKQLIRDDNIYLQVVTDDGRRGPLLRISGSSDKEKFEYSPQDVIDEDGNIIPDDDGGYHKDDTPGGAGISQSDDLDDANDKANINSDLQSNTQVDTQTALGAVKQLMEMVGYLPVMIATLFSFLPSWCLTLIAVMFVFFLPLLFYKILK